MRIDAHQHVWTLARGDYGWLTPELGAIHRDFGPQDLQPLLDTHGIDRTILVQAAPTEAETAFMLEVAQRTPFVAGVVGWCDFAAADVAGRIARLAADPLLVGLRPMAHDIPDPDWLAQPALAPAFAAMVAQGLVFDALIKPPQIAATLTMVARNPDLAVVIDHGAKPDLVDGDLTEWRRGISALAAHPNTLCKLSGLVTEAAADWTIKTLRPAFDHLLESFGARRLIWGSDWPVVMLRAPYGRWIETVEALLAGLTADARAGIMGGNARRVYLTRRGRGERM